MDQHHFTEEAITDSLSRYRTALHDAATAADEDALRDDIIAAAREELYEDDIDAHEIVVSLAEGEFGDRVWNLEEEMLDND
jgi:hypothetical protein